ncbi:MAG: hypothetical protein EZS28_003270 [Streblomastix strix]|uniref:Uncharacterized protein n=1 Tax=Streblomastix strix TaxID=222440 RepID=A0A5J4X3Y8_9EUKA|nr:MAG: hypothetical protein EZS28_003270 [Streblomastix strix]
MKKCLDEPNDDDSFFSAVGNIFRYVIVKDKRINQFAAVAIGSLCKAIQIDQWYGPEIIKFLKEQANPENTFPISRSILALSQLAECQCLLEYK